MTLAFGLAFVVSSEQTTFEGFQEFLAVRIKLSNFLLFFGFCAAWGLIFRSFGLYHSFRIGRRSLELWNVTKAVAVGTALIAVAALAFDISAISRRFLIVFLALALGGSWLVRGLLRPFLSGARRRGRNLRNLVIVGCGQRGAELGREIRSRPDLGYLLLGYIDDLPAPQSPSHPGREKLLGSLDDAEHLLETLDVDEVFIALPVKSYYAEISQILAASEALGLIARLPATAFESRIAKANIHSLGHIPLLTLQTPRPTPGYLAVKRVVDFVASALALVFLAPLFAAIAFAIKVDSAGPVFFGQYRIGRNRRKFRLFKFRTMVADAEARQAELEDLNEVEGAAFKIRRDPRVTCVGRLLRKFSLDELPQLFNVLTGDLSLVGPRPLPVRDWDRFEASWLKRRCSVKPGLTCLWQVNGRHEIPFDQWMELDLQYIDNWSPGLDFQILWQTIPAVIRRTGAS